MRDVNTPAFVDRLSAAVRRKMSARTAMASWSFSRLVLRCEPRKWHEPELDGVVRLEGFDPEDIDGSSGSDWCLAMFAVLPPRPAGELDRYVAHDRGSSRSTR